MEQAKIFRTSVKEHKIPKPTQKTIAKKIVKEGIGKRDIPDFVAEYSHEPLKKEPVEIKPLPMLDEFIRDICKLMNTLRPKLAHIQNNIEHIQSKRLKESFMQDGKELMEIMMEIFSHGKEEKKAKTVLSNCG